MSNTAIQILRMTTVLGLLIAAAALATPPGRLPLALRGVYRIMKRDGALSDRTAPGETSAPIWKRISAFLLVIISLVLALV